MRSIITKPFMSISRGVGSHVAAQAVIYADQLTRGGEDVTINFGGNVYHDFNGFDRMYVYHGNDWHDTLNLFGGVEAFPETWNFKNMTLYLGDVVSLGIQFPPYSEYLDRKLVLARTKRDKKPLREWSECNWDNLRRMERTSPIMKFPFLTDRVVIGDSHVISMYRPGWTTQPVQYKTLHGVLTAKLHTFLDPEITSNGIRELEIYFGNIDVRHHLCRQPNPLELVRDMVREYCDQARELKTGYGYKHLDRIAIYELLPIETIERKISQAGFFKGTPYFGTWKERNDVRLAFRDELVRYAPTVGIEPILWTDYLLNPLGELDTAKMESGKSMHLSRAHYPYWQGLEYNEKDVPMLKGRLKLDESDTLESLFE